MAKSFWEDDAPASSEAAPSASKFWEGDADAAQQALPKDVKPSTASGGRGTVNPPLAAAMLSDAEAARPAGAMGRTIQREAAPDRRSLLERSVDGAAPGRVSDAELAALADQERRSTPAQPRSRTLTSDLTLDPARGTEPRSVPRAAADTALGLYQGAAGMVKGVADNVNAGNNPASDFLETAIKGADRLKSDELRNQQVRRQGRVESAQRAGGELAGARAALQTLFDMPAAALDVGAQGAGSLIPTLLMGAAGAGPRIMGAVNAASTAGDSAQQVAEKLRKLPATVWDGDDKYRALLQAGMNHEQAVAALAPIYALPAQGAGALAGFISGRTGAEKAITGRATGTTIGSRLQSMLAEHGGEQLETLLPGVAGNAVLGAVDGKTGLLEGMGAAAVDTAAGTLAPGAVAGVRPHGATSSAAAPASSQNGAPSSAPRPAPTAEPPADTVAQIAALRDPSSGKTAALLTPSTPTAGLDLRGLQTVDTPMGTFVTADPDVAQAVAQRGAAITDAEMGQLLGYVTPKDATDGTVVQALDPQGNVVHEEATNAAAAPAAAAQAAQMAPAGGAVAQTDAAAALARREERMPGALERAAQAVHGPDPVAPTDIDPHARPRTAAQQLAAQDAVAQIEAEQQARADFEAAIAADAQVLDASATQQDILDTAAAPPAPKPSAKETKAPKRETQPAAPATEPQDERRQALPDAPAAAPAARAAPAAPATQPTAGTADRPARAQPAPAETTYPSVEAATDFIKAQRRRGTNVVAVPYTAPDGSVTVAAQGSPNYAAGVEQREQRRQSERRAAAGIMEGDITRPDGQPFANRRAAMNRAGAGQDVVEVQGGFVVRPQKGGADERNATARTDRPAGDGDRRRSADAAGGVESALGRGAVPAPAVSADPARASAPAEPARVDTGRSNPALKAALSQVDAVNADWRRIEREHGAWFTGDGKTRKLRDDAPQDVRNQYRAYQEAKSAAQTAYDAATKTPASTAADRVDAAAHEAATSEQNDKAAPTDAQKKAGNYSMGHLSGPDVQGLDLTIENPKGSERSGTSPDGTKWSNTMGAHYGYVKGSVAADGDHVDVFVGPAADRAPKVWVVDQVNADGSYDEAKALFGFMNKRAAVAAYRSSYDKGWKVGPVTEMTVQEFKDGLAAGRFKAPLDPDLAKLRKPAISEAKGTTPAAPAPTKEKRATKAERAVAEAEAARAAFFTPGNIVRSYGGRFDEVLAYQPGPRWSVQVQAVQKDGQDWVRVGKPQDARVHMTQPSAKELAAGPVARVTGDVRYTEPRADGKPFPNAPARPSATPMPAMPPLQRMLAFRQQFPLKPPSGMTTEQAVQWLSDRHDAEDAMLASITDAEAEGLLVPGSNGFVGVTKDTSDASKWRITRFDREMEPQGHEVYNNRKEVLDAAFSRYAAPADAAPPAQPSAAQQRADAAAAEKKRRAAGDRARARAWEDNPGRAFLAKHGIALDLANEWAPGQAERRAALVQGFGPIFRRTGMQLDTLAQAAVEEGFLLEPDERAMHALIDRAIRKERVIPQYAAGVSENEMEQRIAQQRQFEEEAYATLQSEHLSDQFIDQLSAMDETDYADVNALLQAAGVTDEEIQAAQALAAAEAAQRRGGDDPGAVEGQPGAADASGAAGEGLTRPTAAQVVAQQERAAQGERADAAARRDRQSRLEADAQLAEFTLTGSDRAADANPNQGTMFSVASPDSRELIVTHNLTERNLLHAAKMGGLPVPSLAITKKTTPLHKFGEITLIGPSEMADPAGYARTQVFGADIYSPRYPSVERELDTKAFNALYKRLKATADKLGMNTSILETSTMQRDGQEHLERSPTFMADFLQHRGIKPAIVFRPGMEPARRERLQQFGLGKYLGETDHFALTENPEFQAAAIAEYRDSLAQALGKKDRIIKSLDSDAAFRDRTVSQTAREIADAARLERSPDVDAVYSRSAMEKQIKDAGLANDYQQHVVDTLNSVTKSERIFQGFTNAGNRRYIPHTLDNVVRLLKKELRGGESFHYGVGSLRAKFTPQFKSVAAIRKEKGRLVPAEQFEALKKEIDDEFWAVGTAISPSLSSDTLIAILEDSARKDPKTVAKSYDYDISDEAARSIRLFLNKLRTMPTAYFEAKIGRAVDVGEFAGAVVPDDASPAVLKALADRGVKAITTYKRGDEQSRNAAVQEAAEKLGDRALFSVNDRAAMGASQGETSPVKTEAAAPEREQKVKALLADLQKQRGQDVAIRAVEPVVDGARAEALAGLRSIAKRLFNHDVVFVQFDGPAIFNGAMSRAVPGTVFLRADSPKQHLAILGHELLHALRAQNPNLYNAMDQRLQKLANDRTADFHVDLGDTYARMGRDMPKDWREELWADVVGDNFVDPEFWRGMAAADPGLMRRVANAITRWLDGVISKLTGLKPFGTDRFLRDANEARRVVTEGMRQFASESQAQRPAATAEMAGAALSAPLPPQTDSAAFRRWFGDSKVVDADGNPLVVYHGTRADFSEFKNGLNKVKGERGIFFSQNPTIASAYAGVDPQGNFHSEEIGSVMPVFLSIKNPLVVDFNGNRNGRVEAIRKARDGGHDGVLLKNMFDAGGIQDQWVAFQPEQIKSAIGNRGTFDAANPDIRLSAADDTSTRSNPALTRAIFEGSMRYTRDQNGRPVLLADQQERYKAIDTDERGQMLLRQGVVTADQLKRWKASPLDVFDGAVNRRFRQHFERAGIVWRDDELRQRFQLDDAAIQAYRDLRAQADTSIARNAVAAMLRKADVDGAAVREQVQGEPMEVAAITLRDHLLALATAEPARNRELTAKANEVIDLLDEANDRMNGGFVPDDMKGDAGGGWQSTVPGRLDRMIYELQDNRIDIKRTQEAITAAGRQIREEFDARLAETLFAGRVAKRTTDFLEREAQPLLADMARNGVDQIELGDYLHARAAPERNAQIAKVNPDMPDGGAGANSKGTILTNANARAYIEAIPADRRKVLEEMAKKVDAITKGTRSLLVAEGLEDAETIRAWERAYSTYVPMFREDVEFSRIVTAKRAMGSERKAVNVLANVLLQREAAINKAEKNRIRVSLYGLALTNPNADFWVTIRPDGDAEQIQQDVVSMGVDPTAAEAGMSKGPMVSRLDPVTGKVTETVNPFLRNLPTAITAMVNGNTRILLLNEKDPRALRLALSLKGADDLTQLDIAGSLVGKTTRWLAAVNTQYNPAFGLVNFWRDAWGGIINLGSTPLRGHTAQVLAGMPGAMAGIAAHLRGQADRGKWSQLFEQFQQDGGQTGFREMFADGTARAEAVDRELARMQRGRADPRRVAGALLRLLSGFNDVMENAVRLSAYAAALDQGLSRPEAARLGRELTVDFNRKGRATRELGPLYAFFNAAVQGNERIVRTLRGPTGRYVIAGGLALGVAQALMLAAAGYDDEDVPDYAKARALIIPLFDKEKRYIAVPLPLGLHVLPNTGRVLTQMVIGDRKHLGRDAFNAVGEISGAFNPLGGGNIFTADGALRTLAPTVVDPIIELGFNRNFAGSPIEREARGETDTRPGFQRARESTQRRATGQAYLGISKSLNRLTGGSDYEPGMVSPTPERVRYVAQVALGGVLRETEKIIDTSVAAARGEKIPGTGVPVVGRFYGKVDEERTTQAKYYQNQREIETAKNKLAAAKKAGDVDAYLDIERRNPMAPFIKSSQRIERQIRHLNKLAVEVIGDPAQQKVVDDARVQAMGELNAAIEEAEKARRKPTIAEQLRVTP